MGLRRVDSGAAQRSLAEVSAIFADVQKDVDSILESSTDLFEVKEASGQIFQDSALMLDAARNLNTAFNALPNTRLFPGLLVGVISGIAAAIGLAGLLFALWREQNQRLRGNRKSTSMNSST